MLIKVEDLLQISLHLINLMLKIIIIRLYIIRIRPIIKLRIIYLSQFIPHIIPNLMKWKK